MTENSDPDGRIWECVRCLSWVGYPGEHLWKAHGITSLRAPDFRLIRGHLHHSRPPRAQQRYRDEPLF